MDTVIRGCKCIFRRRGWSCDEVSVIRHQISQIKFHCSPDKRKGFFSQKLSVQCITVMLPQMTAEPPGAHRPHRVGTGIFILPEISDRAWNVPRYPHYDGSPIHPDDRLLLLSFFRCEAVRSIRSNSDSWQSLKFAFFCHPIIHFCIDIYRIVAAPRSSQVMVPDSLQVCTLCTRFRGRDHKITNGHSETFLL